MRIYFWLRVHIFQKIYEYIFSKRIEYPILLNNYLLILER